MLKTIPLSLFPSALKVAPAAVTASVMPSGMIMVLSSLNSPVMLMRRTVGSAAALARAASSVFNSAFAVPAAVSSPVDALTHKVSAAARVVIFPISASAGDGPG